MSFNSIKIRSRFLNITSLLLIVDSTFKYTRNTIDENTMDEHRAV